MGEPSKAGNKSINSHRECTARHHFLEIEKFIQDQRSACSLFELSKVSTELSNLCITKIRHHSASHICIDTLTFKIRLQLEAIRDTGVWKMLPNFASLVKIRFYLFIYIWFILELLQNFPKICDNIKYSKIT